MENYVGKRLDGRYEIMEIIGVGGMAVVYKAFDNIDHKIVAVKILKHEFLENQEFRRRFKNESKAISVLNHKNIVKVYDVSYGDMLQYIVMEYVEGITLKEYVQQQGKIDPREAIYFVTQILRALQHAHDKGIVHRDIKPQNIMLQSDGTIKVTDFGIARFSRSETRTMTDGAIGSVHYISPEQAKGSIIDARTDLYSVGVMLYEMLTGKLPFQSDNAVSVALMQLQNDPVMPRMINPDIPLGLEQIIMRAMQKNQSDRYQSASEILLDIDAYKKNPNIKFDYLYNAESESASQVTEYRRSASVGAVPPAQRPQRPAQPANRPPQRKPVAKNDFDFENDIDDKSKKKTIAILSGVLGALIICAIALIAIFSSNTDKMDVPDVIGLNFYTDVDKNPLYANYKFNPVIDSESKFEEGTIVDQDPKDGKISREQTITVYVAGPQTKVKVPDVSRKRYNEAEKELRALGFDVTIVKEKNEAVELDKVIRTSPGAGESVGKGTLITVYVATDESVEPVEIPNLIGMTLEEAKAALEKIGLVLDESAVTYRASSATADTIIGFERVGEKVLPGTAIVVILSTGKEAPEEDDETTTDKSTTEETTTQTTTASTTVATTVATTTRPTTAATTTTSITVVIVTTDPPTVVQPVEPEETDPPEVEEPDTDPVVDPEPSEDSEGSEVSEDDGEEAVNIE